MRRTEYWIALALDLLLAMSILGLAAGALAVLAFASGVIQ